MLKNTLTSYGFITKWLHWLMALLFIGMFIVAYTMINIPRSAFRYSLYDLHKATGLLLLCLAALRVMWRMSNLQPGLPMTMPQWQRYAAKSNIIFLYLLMFLMPVSGVLTSTLGGHVISFYGIFSIASLTNNPAASEFFSTAHQFIAYLIMAAFSAHLIAALYHHFIHKDFVLKRMLFNRGTS